MDTCASPAILLGCTRPRAGETQLLGSSTSLFGRMSPHLESTGSSRSAGGVESLRLRARQTLDSLRRELLESSTGEGYWTGRLSPSALSTATAVSALSAVVIHRDDWASSPEGTSDIANIQRCIRSGAEYLRSQQNEDGGFGDTDRSYSNIATSYLALAASTLARQAVDTGLDDQQRDRLQRYLVGAGELDGLRRRYGTDKTFVVPILTNLAIAGVVDWKDVPALPFEAAVFPQSLYRWLQMPVVSYAIPALVAIGQARHFHGPRTFWAIRTVRSASIARTINVLREMQPDSGGYLEATPLTSFVLMSLAATGRADHEVSRRGLAFLVDSMLDDGSWPIDTNLATWVTSLSIHALSRDPDDDGSWCTDSLVDWHLHCQHNRRHPFTGAEPGGWGWTDLSGAVPDSDDTPGAIIAQHQLMRRVDGPRRRECQQAIDRGINWLFRLQNRDGGWPTFCRGWGKLPFDRSSNDLTAHVLRAIDANTCRRSIAGASDVPRSFSIASNEMTGLGCRCGLATRTETTNRIRFMALREYCSSVQLAC